MPLLDVFFTVTWPWNGRGCGSSRPSSPGRAMSPSPPGQAGSQAASTVEGDKLPHLGLAVRDLKDLSDCRRRSAR